MKLISWLSVSLRVPVPTDLQHSVPLLLALIELLSFPHPDMVIPRTSAATVLLCLLATPVLY